MITTGNFAENARILLEIGSWICNNNLSAFFACFVWKDLQIQGPGAATPARTHRTAGAVRTRRPQHGPVYRLCGLHAAGAEPRRRDDRHPVGPPDTQRRRLPGHHRRMPRIRRQARRADDRGHQTHATRHGLRLHPGVGRAAREQSEVLHRETRPRTGADVPAMRRILLELGHLRLESEEHRCGVREIPARTPRAVQRTDARARHRCRTEHRGDGVLGVPRHLDRLRHHGKGRQCLCPLRRIRLE